MLTVNARELRQRLKFYLDMLEMVEDITIIRHSTIIGSIKSANPAKEPEDEKDMIHQLKDGRKVIFRQAKHSDTEAIKYLHRQALESVGAFVEPTGKDMHLDLDLEDVAAHYLGLGGDFIVGELVGEEGEMGEIVAMGGFRLATEGVELKRMRVRPDLHGQGLGTKLLEILEESAKKQGHKTMALDTTDKQHVARHLYESHGYREFKRENTPHFVLIYYKKSL